MLSLSLVRAMNSRSFERGERVDSGVTWKRGMGLGIAMAWLEAESVAILHEDVSIVKGVPPPISRRGAGSGVLWREAWVGL